MAFDRKLLKAFVAVAESGSVGRASISLNATQPTVSRHIRTLELQLGHPLFDRHTQGMSLTAIGQELLPRSRLLLDEMAHALTAIEELRGLRRGKLRIGAVVSVSRGHLPAVLARVMATAPDLDIELTEASEDLLELALLRREVDVVFMTRRPSDADAVRIGSNAFEDEVVAFCAPDNPLLVSKTADIRSILAAKWALPRTGSTPRLRFESAVRELGLPPPTIVVVTDSPDAMMNIVARTSTVGWLPLPILQPAIEAGQLRILDAPALIWRRSFQAYRRAAGTLPHAVHALIRALATDVSKETARASRSATKGPPQRRDRAR
jgi:DNA-binding transcriptional LysR family regulator